MCKFAKKFNTHTLNSNLSVMNKPFALLGAALLAICPMASAQQENESKTAWYIGVGGGFNWSSLHFSPALDSDFYPDFNSRRSGTFSIFAEFDFGPQRAIAIRPQLTWLKRGGEIKRIGKDILWTGEPEECMPDAPYINDMNYRLQANCFDVRIPVIYHIGKLSWKLRPYVFVAPELAFATGGYTQLTQCMSDNTFAGVSYDASKANMASTMFNLAGGIGLKYEIKDAFFVGIEAGYSFGLTNTYGKGERDGDCNALTLLPNPGRVEGKRRMNSWELQFNVGIPFSAFKKKAPQQPMVIEKIVEVPVAAEVVEAPKAVVEVIEPECYSLDQIIILMSQGRGVSGKKICAVDDINFEFGKSTIQRSSYPYLDKLASTLARTDADICVNGHTDNVGSQEANLELSKQRAMAVVEYLKKKGVSADHLSYEYFGFSKPLMSNDTEEGRRMNRRVEFVIK